MTRVVPALALAVVVGTTVGCKSPPADTTRPAETTTTGAETQATRDPDLAVVTVTAVAVDTKLAVLCGLGSSQVYFKYDASTLRPEAKDRLDKIAACARDGAAKGRDLRVIGHTDPLGPDGYNKQLGMSRAESVAKYLSDHGLKTARVETASKGEQLADAADPLSWPEDRRVTIRLAEQPSK